MITKREKEIIREVAEGLSTKEIADKLYISERTVETHRKNIIDKLGLSNFYSVITYSFRNEILN
ncbi:MAG: response regulator transcription factor [Bacteroidetes bacterium]|nr:response regulator transcription factor [Bacteroidota bacterium]MCB9226878.1 response regulator transcription factor [Chitinophagales bacterium]